MSEELHPDIEQDPMRKARADYSHQHLELSLEWDRLVEEHGQLAEKERELFASDAPDLAGLTNIQNRLDDIVKRFNKIISLQREIEDKIKDTYQE